MCFDLHKIFGTRDSLPAVKNGSSSPSTLRLALLHAREKQDAAEQGTAGAENTSIIQAPQVETVLLGINNIYRRHPRVCRPMIDYLNTIFATYLSSSEDLKVT